MQNQSPTILRTFICLIVLILTAGVSSRPQAQSIGLTAEPAFTTAPASWVGCGDGWDTTFTPNGVDGTVEVVVADESGNVYIGGRFTMVNGVQAGGVAKWNGTAWSALGTGVGSFGTVKAIAISGSDVYVGGSFNFSTPTGFAKNVAKWDGSSWTPLGAGLGGGTHVVEAMAMIGSDVYIGGNFNLNDGSPAEGIVRWNGTAYSAVGTGFLGQVRALAANGGAIYVGGNIALAQGSSPGILKWDGANWSTLGTTGNTYVNAIALSGTDIYAIGNIVVGAQSWSVARFNGTTWTGMPGFFSSFLSSAAVLNGELYVAGQISSTTFNNIARWTGTAWAGVAGGVTGDSGSSNQVNGMAVVGNTLFVGGSFGLAGGTGARNIATYTSGTWSGFQGTGIDSPAAAIAVSGSDVYVGGTFTSAGTVTANRIAKWNSITNTWSALGSGITGFGTDSSRVSAIAVAGGKVYAGGSFPRIGGITANNIAVWNGTSWAALGTGVNGSVTSIIVKGEDVYVGGSFQTAGGAPANRVAKWNGTSWAGLNSTHIPNTVSGMAFLGDDLYVGTGTTTVANPAYFSKYDGTTWTMLGADVGDRGVSSVAASDTHVFVAGGFTSLGGVTVNRVARWNGGSWSALGGGLPNGTGQPGFVRLATSGSDLIAIGEFTIAAGSPGDRIARWNGTSWSPLGTGLNEVADTVTAFGGDVFIGGGFARAGCNASPYLARWRQTVWNGSADTNWHNTANWGGGSVPAANVGISIQSQDASITSADVTVNSLIVSGGRTVTIGAGRTLTVTGSLDISNGFIAGPGSLIVQDVSLNGGTLSGLASAVINGNLYLNGGKITGGGTVTVASCRAGSIVGGSSSSFVSSPLTRCVTANGIYRFPVGTGETYAPVELLNLTGSASFTVDPRSGAYSSPAAGLPNDRLNRWWELTNGGITKADIRFYYADADVTTPENRLRAYRISGGSAEVLPTVLDIAANRATVSNVTSFSSWTLAEGQSAPLTLLGRVTNPSGRGAAGVRVTLTDSDGNIRYAMTSPFGYYRFANVMTFKIYTVRVESKQFFFTAPERTVDFDEFTQSVNFVSTNN